MRDKEVTRTSTKDLCGGGWPVSNGIIGHKAKKRVKLKILIRLWSKERVMHKRESQT